MWGWGFVVTMAPVCGEWRHFVLIGRPINTLEWRKGVGLFHRRGGLRPSLQLEPPEELLLLLLLLEKTPGSTISPGVELSATINGLKKTHQSVCRVTLLSATQGSWKRQRLRGLRGSAGFSLEILECPLQLRGRFCLERQDIIAQGDPIVGPGIHDKDRNPRSESTMGYLRKQHD